MKIVICASMSAAKKVTEVAQELAMKGMKIEVPRNIEKHATGQKLQDNRESILAKQQNDLIRDYYNKIDSADAILVVNEDKGGVKNYIGGNTFLEIGFAHVLGKRIYLYNPIPELTYSDEIYAVKPVIISGDLEKIK